MISRNDYRRVESRLYHYGDMMDQLAEFQEKRQRTAPKVDTGMPRGNSSRSDPTALIALMMSQPPTRIQEYQQWIRIIDRAQEALLQSEPGLARLCQLYYRDLADIPVMERGKRLARYMGISPSGLKLRLRRIVRAVYDLAVEAGLLAPGQEELRMELLLAGI